ncbi:hypothetical protein RHMOL_Rhmol07G0163500 [Rhododendron molle]|uniref:Uncharacterized protein n=1 Tax=Rhododendron molle TaxID=49168 RepID=A0ACC0N382_RHOML|nr:hypothetical protein RHMOL_Rhmol07G0163500 [Rhododendron molle]
MDDMLDSECSSGCESGWTLYLENSFLSPYPLKRRKTEKQSVSEDEEEEELSMVSDVSSGPLIFHEECFGNAGYGFFCHAALDVALLKTEGRERKREEIDVGRLRKMTLLSLMTLLALLSSTSPSWSRNREVVSGSKLVLNEEKKKDLFDLSPSDFHLHQFSSFPMYLHSTCLPPVGHSNLKAANILLNEELILVSPTVGWLF